MRKIAIVVPTYNRSADIELFINGTSFLMDYEDADLLIYDSSENENTKNVVFDYNAKQKEKSIIYHLVASETHPNEKFYNIYGRII